MNNIIFLDIDGVLNSSYSMKYYYNNTSLYRNNSIFGKNDRPHPYHVGILNKIIRKSNAKIVLSSTWRLKGIDLCRYLLYKNMMIGDIIDITPHLNGDIRGNEILLWLDNNIDLWKNFIILDDDSDMGFDLLPFFIKTDFKDGLRRKHISQSLKILNGV